MHLFPTNYLNNLLHTTGDRLVRPLVAVYHVTALCNLNCQYCEDFGARHNPLMPAAMPLETAKRVLRIIRDGTDHIILTGGEPLRYPEINELIAYARKTLSFHRITLLTNGLLLPKHEALLPNLSRLVVSLDSLDPVLWANLIGSPVNTAQQIISQIIFYAARQKAFGYQMVINCVLTPETLQGASALISFCQAHDLLISFSPQAVHNWPHYDLLVSPAYQDFLAELIIQKQAGAPILGSLRYLQTLKSFEAYDCYPLLVPRIMPSGELIYPCWPIEKAGNGHGGRPVKLQEMESWEQVLQMAHAAYGPPPRICTSCFQQCYAEPSLMQAKPFDWLRETILYPASRQGDLLHHAPG